MKCSGCEAVHSENEFKNVTAHVLFGGQADDIEDLEEFGELVCPSCLGHFSLNEKNIMVWERVNH